MKFSRCFKGWTAVLLFAALAVSPAVQAHCKGPHADDPGEPDCLTHDHDGGKGGKVGGNLEATFCLDFATPGPGTVLKLVSDGVDFPGTGADYCHDRDQRVSVATGKGPGFNFETYNRNGGTWVRWMTVGCVPEDIALLDWTDDEGTALAPIRCGDPYAMSFRFDQDEGGLDLGSLAPGDTGAVSIFSGLTANDGAAWMFAHGTVPHPATSGHLADNPCVVGTTDLQVTRSSADTWHFSHVGDVCLWDRDASLEFQPGIRVYMDYGFTIVCEDPADCQLTP